MKLLSNGLLLAVLTSGYSYGASAESFLVWKDGKGLAKIEQCRESSQERISLKVSDRAELALSVRESVKIEDKTLVRAIKENPQSTRVQVLGSAQKHMTEGLIATQKLQSLGDYVLEIQDVQTGRKLKGRYLQVVFEDGQYKTISCGTGKSAQRFVVYNVFNAENQQPVGRLGIGENETQFFKSIKIYTSEEADHLLNRQLEEKQLPDSRGSSASTSKPPSVSPPHAISTTAPRGQHLIIKVPLNIKPGAPSEKSTTIDSQTEQNIGAIQTEVPFQVMAAPETAAQVAATGTAIDSVVCLKDGTLSVRDESLQNILFQANKLEVVKIAQGFVAPKDPRYIKVQFSARSADKNTGWVAKEYIQLKSACEMTKPAVQAQRQQANQAAVAVAGAGGALSGDCCNFPLAKRPTTSYKEGMRRFAWRRGANRIHAACDLYGSVGDAVNAVNDGVILRGPYAFYGGVYAVEAVHTGGFVVRYGEVLGKVAAGISSGTKIAKGRAVGFVGQVGGHGKLSPMLHFELYSGKQEGPLTQRGAKGYQRRGDLLNPTDYLSRWEQAKFGASY